MHSGFNTEAGIDGSHGSQVYQAFSQHGTKEFRGSA